MKNYFWNKQVTEVLNELRKIGIEAWDSSCENLDICPSIAISNGAKLMLPNSEQMDEDCGLWNTYILYQDVDDDLGYGIGIEFQTLEGIINYYECN